MTEVGGNGEERFGGQSSTIQMFWVLMTMRLLMQVVGIGLHPPIAGSLICSAQLIGW
ncbi:hypothetical protein CBM2606_A90249 [Cupriavidus taiwanensis]|nr:hypothetical protein CBM2606_A90249 [Cupriavidus taiwanensis]